MSLGEAPRGTRPVNPPSRHVPIRAAARAAVSRASPSLRAEYSRASACSAARRAARSRFQAASRSSGTESSRRDAGGGASVEEEGSMSASANPGATRRTWGRAGGTSHVTEEGPGHEDETDQLNQCYTLIFLYFRPGSHP